MIDMTKVIRKAHEVNIKRVEAGREIELKAYINHVERVVRITVEVGKWLGLRYHVEIAGHSYIYNMEPDDEVREWFAQASDRAYELREQAQKASRQQMQNILDDIERMK